MDSYRHWLMIESGLSNGVLNPKFLVFTKKNFKNLDFRLSQQKIVAFQSN